jgi:hypothetical protein
MPKVCPKIFLLTLSCFLEIEKLPTHHLRKYPAAPPRPIRETKIILVLYAIDVVRDTTTALQDTCVNGEILIDNRYRTIAIILVEPPTSRL